VRKQRKILITSSILLILAVGLGVGSFATFNGATRNRAAGLAVEVVARIRDEPAQEKSLGVALSPDGPLGRDDLDRCGGRSPFCGR
jgi:hypothetical protein